WNELGEFSEGMVALFGLGSVRLQRAGDDILSSRTFSSTFRQNAETSTLQACAPQNAAHRAQFLIDIFGQENVFVEIQRHFIRGEERNNRALIDLARAHRLSILATNGVQYAKPYGREVLDVFICI